jgi:hypothetical protein
VVECCYCIIIMLEHGLGTLCPTFQNGLIGNISTAFHSKFQTDNQANEVLIALSVSCNTFSRGLFPFDAGAALLARGKPGVRNAPHLFCYIRINIEYNDSLTALGKDIFSFFCNSNAHCHPPPYIKSVTGHLRRHGALQYRQHRPVDRK